MERNLTEKGSAAVTLDEVAELEIEIREGTCDKERVLRLCAAYKQLVKDGYSVARRMMEA